MYSWSVILSEPNAPEYELLSNTFQSKKNAQLFAESYVFDFISNVDGSSRLEPFTILKAGDSQMKDLEVSKNYIKRIEEDLSLVNHSSHYIVGNTPGVKEPWGLTVLKLNVFLRPKTVTTIEEEMKEEEIEEEKEITKELTFVIPGRIYNCYEKKIVIETIKEKVKKMVPVKITKEVVTGERVVKRREIFTVSLLKTKIKDEISPVEIAQARTAVANLAHAFSRSKTSQTILNTSCTKVSELIFFHSEEFSRYSVPKYTKIETVKPFENKKREVQVDLRKATSTIKVNLGASLAAFGAEVIKRRLEMFPGIKKE